MLDDISDYRRSTWTCRQPALKNRGHFWIGVVKKNDSAEIIKTWTKLKIKNQRFKTYKYLLLNFTVWNQAIPNLFYPTVLYENNNGCFFLKVRIR